METVMGDGIDTSSNNHYIIHPDQVVQTSKSGILCEKRSTSLANY